MEIVKCHQYDEYFFSISCTNCYSSVLWNVRPYCGDVWYVPRRCTDSEKYNILINMIILS